MSARASAASSASGPSPRATAASSTCRNNTRTGERLDDVSMVLGHDTEGHLIFVSSREEVNGPTIGDVGGVSRLDGNGYYAKTLRSAKRL